MRRSVLATGLLAGTIIGAGIFSLPYIFSRLGIGLGFAYLAGFACVYYFLHRMYARILENNPGEHQFFYLAQKYLPRKISRLASWIILGELIFTLTVYLILAPTFADLMFPGFPYLSLTLFWVVSSIFIFVGLSIMSIAEIVGIFSVIGIVLVVFFSDGARGLETPLFSSVNLSLLLLPFGPLLFSFAGRPAVHEVMKEYEVSKSEGKPFSFKKAIFWGTAIPAIVYGIFVVSILRLNPNVSPEALNSLGFLSPAVLILLGAMGIITLWTSYFVIGANVRDILHDDLRSPHWLSAVLVVVVPFLLYALGFQTFLKAVSFTGGVFLALEGIFVTRMWQSMFRKTIVHPSSILYVIFTAALIYQIVAIL